MFDILVEVVVEKVELWVYIWEYFFNFGCFIFKIKDDCLEGIIKFEMYWNFWVNVKDIVFYNILVLLWGEMEGVLSLEFDFDWEFVLFYLVDLEIYIRVKEVRIFY